MSQICRYYLKGVCRYGSRCHFLHENVDSSYKENFSGYSNSSYHNKYYSNATSHYNNKFTNSYNKYHVDNRSQNQVVAKSTSILSDEEIYDVIQQELREFEERYNWFFTVIAPLKDLGNLPGLNDLSPEELRYQYYESCLNNSLPEFIQNLNSAKNDVAQICQLFKTKSKAAYEIVKNMIQKQKTGEMAGGNHSTAASTFKFDLNALSKPSVFTTQPIQPSEPLFSNFPIEVSSINGSVFPSSDFSMAPFNNFTTNESTSPNIGSNSTNNFHQQTPSINSFSFSLNKLQSSQNIPPVFDNSRHDSASSVFNTPNSVTNLSVFDNPNPNVNTSVFNNSQSTFNISNCNVFDNSTDVSLTMESSIYSKHEEIPYDTLKAFQEKTFQIGHVPLDAPSKELCYN